MLVDERYAVVVGGVLSPWRLRGGHRAVASADELRAFAEPGWVRVATAFTVSPEGAGCRVRTGRGSRPPTRARAGGSDATGA